MYDSRCLLKGFSMICQEILILLTMSLLIALSWVSFELMVGSILEVLLNFRIGLSWLRMVKDSEPSFLPDITKLILIT